jgi:creatinine amidohydrolase
MYWQHLSSPRLDELDRGTPVLLPIAAIEQHGPHLPLATDRLINEHFCRELNGRYGENVLILPTIAVTCSAHHMDFAGTLTLRHETLLACIVETLESAAAHGFRNLVIFNSHGGNLGIARVALEKMGAAHAECRVVLATWWQLAAHKLARLNESGLGGVGHACEFETSLIMAAAPELVDENAIEPRQNRPTFAWAEADLLRGPRAALYRTMRQVSPNGAQGDPTAASREKGEAITKVVVAALEELLRDLQQAAI